jgi:hypothetical protein
MRRMRGEVPEEDHTLSKPCCVNCHRILPSVAVFIFLYTENRRKTEDVQQIIDMRGEHKEKNRF